jgi:hypothetical protein
METIAILKNPRLSVDDCDLVALRFDAAVDGRGALQLLYLEGSGARVVVHIAQFIELIRAAGSFDRLAGTPIIVERDPVARTMHYVRPADV